ncbi:hypothetical protein [Microcoleus sp. N3A4]|uniref:hypothetical protein n=1 Tax=Microcoleus sp. N3A4 TaxID=3055379 RepID=UPI002FD50F81
MKWMVRSQIALSYNRFLSTSDRCTPEITHALQRAPNSKLKSPHLNYSLFANVE